MIEKRTQQPITVEMIDEIFQQLYLNLQRIFKDHDSITVQVESISTAYNEYIDVIQNLILKAELNRDSLRVIFSAFVRNRTYIDNFIRREISKRKMKDSVDEIIKSINTRHDNFTSKYSENLACEEKKPSDESEIEEDFSALLHECEVILKRINTNKPKWLAQRNKRSSNILSESFDDLQSRLINTMYSIEKSNIDTQKKLLAIKHSWQKFNKYYRAILSRHPGAEESLILFIEARYINLKYALNNLAKRFINTSSSRFPIESCHENVQADFSLTVAKNTSEAEAENSSLQLDDEGIINAITVATQSLKAGSESTYLVDKWNFDKQLIDQLVRHWKIIFEISNNPHAEWDRSKSELRAIYLHTLAPRYHPDKCKKDLDDQEKLVFSTMSNYLKFVTKEIKLFYLSTLNNTSVDRTDLEDDIDAWWDQNIRDAIYQQAKLKEEIDNQGTVLEIHSNKVHLIIEQSRVIKLEVEKLEGVQEATTKTIKNIDHQLLETEEKSRGNEVLLNGLLAQLENQTHHTMDMDKIMHRVVGSSTGHH